MVETIAIICSAQLRAGQYEQKLGELKIDNPTALEHVNVARSSLMQAVRELKIAARILVPPNFSHPLPEETEPVKPAADPK